MFKVVKGHQGFITFISGALGEFVSTKSSPHKPTFTRFVIHLCCSVSESVYIGHHQDPKAPSISPKSKSSPTKTSTTPLSFSSFIPRKQPPTEGHKLQSKRRLPLETSKPRSWRWCIVPSSLLFCDHRARTSWWTGRVVVVVVCCWRTGACFFCCCCCCWRWWWWWWWCWSEVIHGLGVTSYV